MKYDPLQVQHEELKRNNTNQDAHIKQFQDDIKQMTMKKGISDLSMLVGVRNKTSLIKDELVTTNSRINALSADAEARKQDFLALYNKERATEERIANISYSMNRTLNQISFIQNQTLRVIQDEMHHLQDLHLQTSDRLNREIHSMSGRGS